MTTTPTMTTDTLAVPGAVLTYDRIDAPTGIAQGRTGNLWRSCITPARTPERHAEPLGPVR